MSTILDVFNRARQVHLNDSGAAIYTDSVLLPIVKAANDELSDELLKNGITVQKAVDTEVDVDADDTTVTLPNDIINPIQLYDRVRGSVNESDWVEVAYQDNFLPNQTSLTSIQWWTWQNQQIKIVPPTNNREARIRYNRLLVAISNTNSSVEVNGSINFLAAKTAALAALGIGRNPVRAAEIQLQAGQYLTSLMQIGVRNLQKRSFKRKPFRFQRTISIR